MTSDNEIIAMSDKLSRLNIFIMMAICGLWYCRRSLVNARQVSFIKRSGPVWHRSRTPGEKETRTKISGSGCSSTSRD